MVLARPYRSWRVLTGPLLPWPDQFASCGLARTTTVNCRPAMTKTGNYGCVRTTFGKLWSGQDHNWQVVVRTTTANYGPARTTTGKYGPAGTTTGNYGPARTTTGNYGCVRTTLAMVVLVGPQLALLVLAGPQLAMMVLVGPQLAIVVLAGP